MLIVFQFPIVDIRYLIENNHQIPVPAWPNPDTRKMVRNFGQINLRPRGGVSDWSGEHRYCSTRKALKLIGLDSVRFDLNSYAFLRTDCAFRRLHSDGRFLVKYEIGFSNKFEQLNPDLNLRNSIEDITTWYTNLKVKVKKQNGQYAESILIETGKDLSDLYFNSTTYSSHIDPGKNHEWWIQPGEPVCIIELDGKRQKELPKYTTTVKPDLNGVQLFHSWIELHNKKRLRTWIICKSGNDDEFIRKLRLNLLRINAEKETLRKVLFFLNWKKNELLNTEDNKRFIGRYLEKCTSKLLKEIRYGINQNDFLDIALEAEEHARPGELQSYIETVEPLKNKYVTSNIEQIINKGTIIQVTGGEINSINVTEKGDIKNYGN